jgi:hypothetical protein
MRRRGRKPISHLRPWSGWLVRAWMRGEAVRHCGLAIYCGRPAEARQMILERVTAALDQIERFDRRRLERIVRERVTIVIMASEGRHFYSERVNAICLDSRILRRETSTTSTIACAIVHESVHARFALAGLFYNQTCAARMERRCIEEEIAYVARSPYVNRDEFTKWAALRRAALEHPWWTRRGRLEAFAKFLESEGAPAWMPRLFRIRARLTLG